MSQRYELFLIYAKNYDVYYSLVAKKEFVLTEKAGSKATINILYGFGYVWTDENIKEDISTISRIEIISKLDTIVLKDQDAIFKYYKAHRKGIFKQTILMKF